MNSHWLKVETVRLELARLRRPFAGFRMAQISDIHMGGWMNPERFQQVADVVIAQKPDVLLITGGFPLRSPFYQYGKSGNP